MVLGFEVDAFDIDARTGWSVLVVGIASHVTDPDEAAHLERVPRPGLRLVPRRTMSASATVRVEPGRDRRGRAMVLFGQEHVERYRATGGEEGHEWRPGVHTLLLTTTGRKSGEPYTTPLIYGEDDGSYVIVASKGGAPNHPDWYRNLEANPEVEIQVEDQVMKASAHLASGEDRERLWKMMAEIWPKYDEYQRRTDRKIPVVVLEPHG